MNNKAQNHKKLMKKIMFLMSTYLLTSYVVFAQKFPRYYQSNLVKVLNSDYQALKNPFGGGLKFPVLQNFDLNADGIKDIVLIDRTDNKVLTFINHGNMYFVYRPEFEKLFPDSLASFIKFRDYNGDGKQDLFTYAISTGAGISVYQNISNELEGIKFKMVSPYLNSFFYGDLNPDKLYNLPMFSIDIPEIIDLDGDGDIDILTFDELGGAWLQYYRNISMEIYGIKDSLLFSCVDNYWGNFYETDSSNDVVLNSARQWGYKNYHENYDSLRKAWGISKIIDRNKQQNPVISMKKTPLRHAGSTVMAGDMDGDNDLDLIIGDVTYPMVNYLENGKNDHQLSYDKIIKSELYFPRYDTPVNIRSMPNVNVLDVDNDGVNDMVFSPTDMDIIDSFQSLNQIWLYLNKGTNNNVQLQLSRKNFLQEDMIDLGGASSPAFVDVDADGDLDLVVATIGDFIKTFYRNDYLVLFENIGNKDSAVFILKDSNWMNISSKKLRDIVPAFGDIDQDGDKDLLLGQYNGRLVYYENTAGAGKPMNLTFVSDFYQNIDVGNYSAPCIHDIDKDGLVDLILGQNAGRLSYYHNSGVAGNPVFQLVTDTFGGIFFPKSDHLTTPTINDIDSNGQDDLIIGIDIIHPHYAIVKGNIFFYKDISASHGATFTQIDSLIWDIQSKTPVTYSFGNRLRPAVADLDGDSVPDLLLGNSRGGLLFFGSNSSITTQITADKSLILCSGDSITLDAGEGFDAYQWNTGETSRKITVRNAKTYSCEVRKGSLTYTAYITIKQHPGYVIADFNYQADEREVRFTALNDNVQYIHWDFGDGSVSFSLNPIHHYLQQGTYNVCMSIADKCGAVDKECKKIFVSSTLNELAVSKVQIFPNPFRDNIQLNLEGIVLENNLNIQLLNSTGQLILEREIKHDEDKIINTSGLNNGIYFLKIRDVSGKISLTEKLIKI